MKGYTTEEGYMRVVNGRHLESFKCLLVYVSNAFFVYLLTGPRKADIIFLPYQKHVV